MTLAEKNKKWRPVMFVGTGSDVGKSIINAAFCRIFKQDGLHPAPFKAQNMSLNSYASAEGLELGRAQAMQAEACGIPCSSDMNPILLKPTSYMQSQIVLNGKPAGNQSAREYFMQSDRDFLFGEAMNAYNRLAERYSPMVIEGAGSISEINLREKDITNMRVALEVNAAVFLIADIDRGGVFGSVYGTLELLPEEERRLVTGIIINKFRGDISLFETGRTMMEELCKVPVVGVIPYFQDIYLEDEDSVVIDKKQSHTVAGMVNVAVVLLRHMSNFTDFNVLERTPGVHLFYSANASEIEKADVVILPGSKNTMADLSYLRQTGLAKAILNAHQCGKTVVGICGGYQMLGQELHDPMGVEGPVETMPGLGVLPVSTTMQAEKRTVQSRFSFLGRADNCEAYEIHMGETTRLGGKALCRLDDGRDDGCMLDDRTWGTYLHGIFDNAEVVNYLLETSGKRTDIQPFNYQQFKEEQYDKLANHVRENCDMSIVYNALQNNCLC